MKGEKSILFKSQILAAGQPSALSAASSGLPRL